MYAISMYLNEIPAHLDGSVWPDVADPATQTPMAPRHVQIRSMYDRLAKEGKPQPQMKTASFCAPADALACVSLGADHLTIGKAVLTDLDQFSTLPEYRKGMWGVPFAKQNDRPWNTWVPRKYSDPDIQALLSHDPLSADGQVPSADVDYLAPGVVDSLNDADPATRERLKFALDMFTSMEEKSRVFIQGLQK